MASAPTSARDGDAHAGATATLTLRPEDLLTGDGAALERAINDLLDAAATEGIAPPGEEAEERAREFAAAEYTSGELLLAPGAQKPSQAAVLQRFETWLRKRNEKLEAARVELRAAREVDPECTFSPTHMPSVRASARRPPVGVADGLLHARALWRPSTRRKSVDARRLIVSHSFGASLPPPHPPTHRVAEADVPLGAGELRQARGEPPGGVGGSAAGSAVVQGGGEARGRAGGVHLRSSARDAQQRRRCGGRRPCVTLVARGGL